MNIIKNALRALAASVFFTMPFVSMDLLGWSGSAVVFSLVAVGLGLSFVGEIDW